jgi:hypothetical protein
MAEDSKLLQDLLKAIENLADKRSSDSDDGGGSTTPPAGATPSAPVNSKAIEAQIEALKEKNEALKRTAVLEEDIQKIEKNKEKIAKLQFDLDKQILKQRLESHDLSLEEYELELKRLKVKEQETRDRKKELEDSKQLNQQMVESIGNFMGIQTAMSMLSPQGLGQIAGEFMQMRKELVLSGATIDDTYAPFSDFFRESNKSLGIFVGQTRSLNGEVRTTFTRFGIGAKELMAANIGLRDSMTSFSNESERNKQIMVGQAAQLEKLGASYSEQGPILNHLKSALGFTGAEAAAVTNKLSRVAYASGISTKKMLADYAAVGPSLAAQGKQSVTVFENLAKQSKALGMEVSSLMNIVGKQMDTFEGAASAAGKFNAFMGGDYLNSIELLNADESQRTEIIKRSMEATGKNVATMNKQERQALANILAGGNEAEMMKMLGQETDQVRKAREKEEASQKQMNQLQEQAVDVMGKIHAMFQVVTGVVMPFVKVIDAVVTKFMEFNDKTGGRAGIIIVGLLLAKMISSKLIPAFNDMRTSVWESMKSSYSAIRTNMSAARTAFSTARAAGTGFFSSVKAGAKSLSNISMGGFIGTLISLIPLIMMLWESFHDVHDVLSVPHSPILTDTLSTTLPMAFDAIGKALEPLIKPAIAFGFAMLEIGGAVWLAATGMAELVKAFSGLSGEQIIGAVVAIGLLVGVMYLMATALIAVATTAGVAAIPMLAFGAAVLMIGIGIGVAAAGLSLLVEKFVELVQVDGIVPTILALSAGVWILAGGIGALALSFAGLAIAAGPAWLASKAVASAIENINEAYDEYPAEKAIGFKVSNDNLKQVLSEIKQISSDNIDPTIRLLKEAKEYVVSVSENEVEDDPVVKLLSKIVEIVGDARSKMTSAGANSGGGGSYVIKVDERMFAELVKKVAPGIEIKTGTLIAG